MTPQREYQSLGERHRGAVSSPPSSHAYRKSILTQLERDASRSASRSGRARFSGLDACRRARTRGARRITACNSQRDAVRTASTVVAGQPQGGQPGQRGRQLGRPALRAAWRVAGGLGQNMGAGNAMARGGMGNPGMGGNMGRTGRRWPVRRMAGRPRWAAPRWAAWPPIPAPAGGIRGGVPRCTDGRSGRPGRRLRRRHGRLRRRDGRLPRRHGWLGGGHGGGGGGHR